MKKTPVSNVLAVLVLSAALLGATPLSARAFDMTWDVPNSVAQFGVFLEQLAGTLLEEEGWAKEYILDPAAWAASQAALQSTTQSMVNWVSSGFNGSPGFVTDLNESLLSVGDASAENFIDSLRSEGRIESPFSNTTITQALDTYYRTTGSGVFGRVNPYTLDESCANHEAFVSGDITACGLSGLRRVLLNPLGETPEGSRIAITDSLFQQASSDQDVARTEFDWANGLMSWRGSCGEESATATTGEGDTSTESTETTETTTDASLSSALSTYGCPILTSGSVVFEELAKEIGIGVEQSANADEISELIGSAFSQFITSEIFGEGGIAGEGSSGGGSRPTGEDTPTTTSVVSAFSRMIELQRSRLLEYQTGWVKIDTQAELAKTNLEQCGTPAAQTALTNEVLPLLQESNTTLEDVATILLALSDIGARADSAANFAEFEEATKDYDALISGNEPYENVSFPAAQDFVALAQDTQDTGGVKNPPSTYERMKELSESCSVPPLTS